MHHQFSRGDPVILIQNQNIILQKLQYLDHQTLGQEVQAGVLVLVIVLLLQKLLMVACVVAVQYDLASHWLLQHEPGPELEVVDMLHTSLGLWPSKRHPQLARSAHIDTVSKLNCCVSFVLQNHLTELEVCPQVMLGDNIPKSLVTSD